HLWSVDNEQRKALFTQPDNSITTNRYLASAEFINQSYLPFPDGDGTDVMAAVMVMARPRWSAIDFLAGTEKRSAPPPAAVPQQPAPVVKKEAVKVKVQPKEEANDASSQPSSPEKTAKTATGGRLTTPAKPAAAGKKGASSPTKKQPGGAREMTSFFKKAPEEEKTQTLIANAKAGK
ncbi:hypothetical protein GR268_44550, partial [Rhizobium leguminosarum]|nr:hypothetical protein [Rhizobium leguminosarum]